MQNKRSEKIMLELILRIAEEDERIRAVVMNGSRTSSHAKKDHFQDFDIVYIVQDVIPFVENKEWVKQFGETLIIQTPEEMDGLWENDKSLFGYLLQFKDRNRIDLRLIQQSTFLSMHKDSQTLLLLDKDGILGAYPPPTDNDYLSTLPTEKEFNNCCNEFFWVSMGVAKGIGRKELTYAKHLAEHIIKEELIKLLTWYAGIKNNFSKPIGKFGRYLENYLEPEVWNKFLKTYVDADYNQMWNGLFAMCELFNEIALKISKQFSYVYHEHEYLAVLEYLKLIREECR